MRESGVARSACYRRFRSRDDVVEQLTASVREAVLAAEIDVDTEGWQYVFALADALSPRDMSLEERFGCLAWKGAFVNLVRNFIEYPTTRWMSHLPREV
ncbi:hypothetical protein [Corynebacterium sp. SA-MJD20WY100]|uniref:hypothetical protein n=1 Tax=Corynebacterium sp. SA-MJD20WY100 TaxID=3142969 RepID=UPI00322194F1